MKSQRISAKLLRLVRIGANGHCEYCRLPQSSQEATFHVDHVEPRSAGGSTTSTNLALACVTCSLRKAAKIRAIDPRTGLHASLFNPRKQVWTDHFAWTSSLRLAGKTSTGRATIVSLKMNRPAIVAIRLQLAALGEFPSADF